MSNYLESLQKYQEEIQSHIDETVLQIEYHGKSYDLLKIRLNNLKKSYQINLKRIKEEQKNNNK